MGYEVRPQVTVADQLYLCAGGKTAFMKEWIVQSQTMMKWMK